MADSARKMDRERMDDLLAKSKRGEMTDAEEMEKSFNEMYCPTGIRYLQSLLHLRARDALGQFPAGA